MPLRVNPCLPHWLKPHGLYNWGVSLPSKATGEVASAGQWGPALCALDLIRADLCVWWVGVVCKCACVCVLNACVSRWVGSLLRKCYEFRFYHSLRKDHWSQCWQMTFTLLVPNGDKCRGKAVSKWFFLFSYLSIKVMYQTRLSRSLESLFIFTNYQHKVRSEVMILYSLDI